MVESIKKVLMRRDGMSSEEANSLIKEARDDFQARIEGGDMCAGEAVCEEYFGLEPDYVMELIW